MADVIVYALVTKGGGVDGLDPSDRGGRTLAVHRTKTDAEKDNRAPWCVIRAEVLDINAAKRAALLKLSPVDRFALGV